MNAKKTINVVAAIIRKDDRILATQRGYGEFKGGYEFPGGKIEEGESKEDALIREIREELDININITEFLHRVEYEYESFNLIMDCYFANIESGDIKLLEHSDMKWLKKEELDSLSWLPADVEIIEILKRVM